MSRAVPVLLALVLAAALPGRAAASPQERGRWRGPLPGARVVAPFTFDSGAPYARGARRGIDLRGRPGQSVLAACSGTVTFAGTVPGRRRGITLSCGALRATVLGLSTVAVRRGARVRAGAPVGRLGPLGVLRLGARRAGRRHGYIDPAPLLAAPATAPPPAARRTPPPPVVRRRTTAPPTGAAPLHVRWPAWAGLALLSAGASGGAATTRRRRRAARARIQAAHRYR